MTKFDTRTSRLIKADLGYLPLFGLHKSKPDFFWPHKEDFEGLLSSNRLVVKGFNIVASTSPLGIHAIQLVFHPKGTKSPLFCAEHYKGPMDFKKICFPSQVESITGGRGHNVWTMVFNCAGGQSVG